MSDLNSSIACPAAEETCPAAEEIYLYANGKYKDQRATDIETHLLACAQCETLLDSLDDPSDALIQALATLPVSSDDEVAYQELYAAVLAKPTRFADEPEAAAQFRNDSRLADPALGPLPCRLGSYELQFCIGRGASGAVYRAKHVKLDQAVAVKVLDGSRSFATDSFLQEMKTIGSLAHPHIVRATDAGEADGLHFLVMEYVDGIDAARLLFRAGPLRVADACEIIRQAALGLQCVHDRSLVHRDIKPSNLLVTVEGQVKLLDLGIAIRSDGQQSNAKPLGTSDYMAPEQRDNPATVDHRADLYSLGCTLHRLLTGKAPVKPYAVPPEVPRAVERLLHRLLAPAPADRPASANEVIESLRPHVRGADLQTLVATTCPNLPTPKPSTKPQGNRNVPSRRTALVGLATAGAAVMLFSRLRFGKSPQLQKTLWRGLSPVAPKLLMSLGPPGHATLRTNGASEIAVDSEALTLIHLGRPVSGLFQLEVDLLQEDWQGGGVFFQWQYDTKQTAPLFRFQSVELKPSTDSSAPRKLLWSQWTAKREGGKVITHKNRLGRSRRRTFAQPPRAAASNSLRATRYARNCLEWSEPAFLKLATFYRGPQPPATLCRPTVDRIPWQARAFKSARQHHLP